MKNVSQFAAVHPIVIFWLGLLTGAIVVALVFMYGAMVPADYESALYRFNFRSVPQLNQLSPDAYGAGTPQPLMPQGSVDAGTPQPLMTR